MTEVTLQSPEEFADAFLAKTYGIVSSDEWRAALIEALTDGPFNIVRTRDETIATLVEALKYIRRRLPAGKVDTLKSAAKSYYVFACELQKIADDALSNLPAATKAQAEEVAGLRTRVVELEAHVKHLRCVRP